MLMDFCVQNNQIRKIYQHKYFEIKRSNLQVCIIKKITAKHDVVVFDIGDVLGVNQNKKSWVVRLSFLERDVNPRLTEEFP